MSRLYLLSKHYVAQVIGEYLCGFLSPSIKYFYLVFL